MNKSSFGKMSQENNPEASSESVSKALPQCLVRKQAIPINTVKKENTADQTVQRARFRSVKRKRYLWKQQPTITTTTTNTTTPITNPKSDIMEMPFQNLTKTEFALLFREYKSQVEFSKSKQNTTRECGVQVNLSISSPFHNTTNERKLYIQFPAIQWKESSNWLNYGAILSKDYSYEMTLNRIKKETMKSNKMIQSSQLKPLNAVQSMNNERIQINNKTVTIPQALVCYDIVNKYVIDQLLELNVNKQYMNLLSKKMMTIIMNEKKSILSHSEVKQLDKIENEKRIDLKQMELPITRKIHERIMKKKSAHEEEKCELDGKEKAKSNEKNMQSLSTDVLNKKESGKRKLSITNSIVMNDTTKRLCRNLGGGNPCNACKRKMYSQEGVRIGTECYYHFGCFKCNGCGITLPRFSYTVIKCAGYCRACSRRN